MNKDKTKLENKMWKAIRRYADMGNYAKVSSLKFFDGLTLGQKIVSLLELVFTGRTERILFWSNYTRSGTTPMIIKYNYPEHILCERCGARAVFGLKDNGSDTPKQNK